MVRPRVLADNSWLSGGGGSRAPAGGLALDTLPQDIGEPAAERPALDDEESRENLIADQSFGRDDPVVTYEDEATGTNLVMFASGGGDGRYPTWVGYTADGEVACFLTDFGTLTPRWG